MNSDSRNSKILHKNDYKFIRRLPSLAKDNANGNDLLNYHYKKSLQIYIFNFYYLPLDEGIHNK